MGILIKFFLTLVGVWALSLTALAYLTGRFEYLILLILALVLAIIIRLFIISKILRSSRKTLAKKEVYVGDCYDSQTRRYQKVYIPMENLCTTIIYGNPWNMLLNLFAQVAQYRDIVTFDADGSLGPMLKRFVPVRIINPDEFPVDPFELDVREVTTIFDLAFREANYELRAKIGSLIISYYETLGKSEAPSLKDFATVFLDTKENASKADKWAITKVQDLFREIFQLDCFSKNPNVKSVPPAFLLFDLSSLLNKSARMIYTLAALGYIYRHWGSFFAIINGEILTMEGRHNGESMKMMSQMFNRNVYICLTTTGCPIDPTVFNHADTFFVGNCLGDYRLICALRHMFPKLSPASLRPIEYLFKSGEYKALLVSQAPKEMMIKTIGKVREKATALELEVGDDAKKAYEILKRISEVEHISRTALINYFGEKVEVEVIVDKLSSLGYIVFRTEQVRNRFVPVIKLTHKGIEALKEFDMRVKGQRTLEVV